MINFGFWEKLKTKKPFFVLAPMADVTDAAFRRLIAKYSRPNGPDVFWTEFVSADGLCSPGRESLLVDFMYTEAERPIVAQIFGSDPGHIERAAAIARELGFDGIDINMGCPDRSIEKQGAGAAMIKNPAQAKEVIRAAKRGAGDLPVSVKTRIGYNKNEIATWVPALLEEDIPALTMHLRTRKEMSLVPARWEHLREIRDIRDRMGKETLLIGNGDVADLADGRARAEEYGADGVMIGRGIFGSPWRFAGTEEPDLAEKFEIMIEHTKLFEELLGAHKNFAIMKKHYKAYINGFDGAKELRMKLMDAENAADVERIAREFLSSTSAR